MLLSPLVELGKRVNNGPLSKAVQAIPLVQLDNAILVQGGAKKVRTTKQDKRLQQYAATDFHAAASPIVVAKQLPVKARGTPEQLAHATISARTEAVLNAAQPAQQHDPASTAPPAAPVPPPTSSPLSPPAPPAPSNNAAHTSSSSASAASLEDKALQRDIEKLQKKHSRDARRVAEQAAELDKLRQQKAALVLHSSNSGGQQPRQDQPQQDQQQQQQLQQQTSPPPPPSSSSSSQQQPGAPNGRAAGGRSGSAKPVDPQLQRKLRVIHSRGDTELHQLNEPSDRDLTLVIDAPPSVNSRSPLFRLRARRPSPGDDVARTQLAQLLSATHGLAIPAPRLPHLLSDAAVENWQQLRAVVDYRSGEEQLSQEEVSYYLGGFNYLDGLGGDPRGFMVGSAGLPDSACHTTWLDYLAPSSYVISATSSKSTPGGRRLIVRLSFVNPIILHVVKTLLAAYVALANGQEDEGARRRNAPAVIPEPSCRLWRSLASRSGVSGVVQSLACEDYVPRYVSTLVSGWPRGPLTSDDPGTRGLFQHTYQPLGSLQALRHLIAARAPHCTRLHLHPYNGRSFTVQFFHEAEYLRELFQLNGAVSPQHQIHSPLKLSFSAHAPPAAQCCSVCGVAGHQGRSCPQAAPWLEAAAARTQEAMSVDSHSEAAPSAPPLPRPCLNCYSLDPQHACQTQPDQRHCRLCDKRGHTSFTCAQYRAHWTPLVIPAVSHAPNPRPQHIVNAMRGRPWSQVVAAGVQASAVAQPPAAAQQPGQLIAPPAWPLQSATHFPPLQAATSLPPSPPPSTASLPPSPQSSVPSPPPSPPASFDMDAWMAAAFLKFMPMLERTISSMVSQAIQQQLDQALPSLAQRMLSDHAAPFISKQLAASLTQQEPSAVAAYGNSISAAMMSGPSASPAQQLLQPQPQPYPQAPATTSAFATPSASSPSSQPARGPGPEASPHYVSNNNMQYSMVNNMLLPPSTSPANSAGPLPHPSPSAPQSAGLMNAQHQAPPPNYQQQ